MNGGSGNMMNRGFNSGIDAFRSGAWWVRTIAVVTVVAFGGLVTVPAVAATRAEIERQQRLAPLEQSDSAKLNTALVQIRNELREFAGRPDALDRVASTDERKAARERLKALRAQLRELDKTARDDFRAVEKALKTEDLPAVILERHRDAVAKYAAEADALLNDLAAIETLDDSQAVERAMKTFERLDQQKLQRPQQPFDPEQLPNRSLKADDRREPRSDAAAFIADLNGFDAELAVAANDDYDIGGLQDANNATYLAPTTEVVLSEAIQAKAAELGHDPVAIYQWVRNNVQWQPSWGAVQDADLTLSAKRGNAFDIASLTIALLRAAGIPARYVHGTIDVPEAQFRNWAGGFDHINAAMDFAGSGGIPITSIVSNGAITKVRLEHVWVEAALDFHPSRGAINRAADTWVPIDPSFKQYEILEGLDVVAVSGLDADALTSDLLNSATVNEDEGWVTGLDPVVLQNAQTQAQQALSDYIAENLPDATVGDVLGGRRIIEQQDELLAGTLENRVIVAGNRYAEVPGRLRQHIVFGFGADLFGEPQQSIRLPWTRLNNERVTLSFRPATQADEDALRSLLPEDDVSDISDLPTTIPAYLINVVPELKVNGAVVMTGDAMNPGEEMRLVFTSEFADGHVAPNTYNVIAGSYLALAVVAGNVSPKAVSDGQERIEATRETLLSSDVAKMAALGREEILGELFHVGMLGYYAELNGFTFATGLIRKGHHYLAAGLGSYGYEPEVDYFFGLPRAVRGGGAVMNVPIVNVWGFDGDGTASAKKQKLDFILNAGLLSSGLEHSIPEQMFGSPENPVEGISAVKAIGIANAAGQRIFHITPANQSQVLPQINHDALVMGEIRAALTAGREVITHTDAVSVPGWSGAGYIMYDPVTGDGAYKIGGGANGAFLLFLGALLIVFAMFFISAGIVALPVFLALSAGMHAFVIGLALSWSLFDVDVFIAVAALVLALIIVLAMTPVLALTAAAGIAANIIGLVLALISFLRLL